LSHLDAARRERSRPLYALIAVLASAGLMAPSLAQDTPPQAGQAPKAAAQATQGADSLATRLGRLEEKVKDLQVMIGTLQSFVSAKPGAMLPQELPAPAPQTQAVDSSLGPRIDALETQIKALTNHVEQIGRQMSALEAKLSALQLPPAPPPVPAPTQEEPPPLRQGEAPMPAPQQEAPPLRQGEAPLPPTDTEAASVGSIGENNGGADENFDRSKPRWYGPKPGTEEFAALIQREAGLEPPAEEQPQNLMAHVTGDAQTLYQQGYGALLQKDYAGAEGAFRQLVDAYPNDPLAADAQYWIGETYYVRGQYKNAADAFLNGYKKHKSGQKAPDTLLKLGMSLAELGQKDAACATFDELKTKFPRAPVPISDEAKAWRKKTGC
jgi:tol-pal system protein YbgF